MSLLRFVFWFLVSVVMAYFMTDYRVKGKTIKEHIDEIIFSDEGRAAIGEGIDSTITVMKKAKDDIVEKADGVKRDVVEEITHDDEDQLRDLLK